MIEKDTIRLLRECDAGIQMGLSAISEVSGRIRTPAFRALLRRSREEHEMLEKDIRRQLDRFQDEGKEPSPLAEGMSWLKTNAAMAWDESDNTAASLLTDGCHMGVKSLSRYLNQYKAADERSKDCAKRLIHLEEQLAENMRTYL